MCRLIVVEPNRIVHLTRPETWAISLVRRVSIYAYVKNGPTEKPIPSEMDRYWISSVFCKIASAVDQDPASCRNW